MNIDLGAIGPALAAFAVILPAELPDKTFVATLVLATRFRASAVWIGVTAAFAVQCAIAVLAGGLLSLLPGAVVLAGSGLLFAIGSVVMIRGGLRARVEAELVEAEPAAAESDAVPPADAGVGIGRLRLPGGPRTAALQPVVTSFLVLFVAEWGDLSQLLTAGLAARYDAPLSVFVGSLTALATIAAIAVLAGSWLRERLPLARIQLFAGAVLGVLATVSLVEAVRSL